MCIMAGRWLFSPKALRETWSAKHGPWSARIELSLASDERETLSAHAAWDHRSIATVSPAFTGPSNLIDSILHAARLARGLTLLTQGTTLDLPTRIYSNPSDWNDRPLTLFPGRRPYPGESGRFP